MKRLFIHLLFLVLLFTGSGCLLGGGEGSTGVGNGFSLGDVNRNGKVNAEDLFITASCEGSAVNGLCVFTDLDSSGTIDSVDTALVALESLPPGPNGDVNRSGAADQADALIIYLCVISSSPPAFCVIYVDIDGNGLVSGNDFDLFVSSFYTYSPPVFPMDFDGNGVQDGADLGGIFYCQMHVVVPPIGDHPCDGADVNGDGVVDQGDIDDFNDTLP